MSSLNKPRFRNEVHDIANQLMHLMEHRERLLEAETIWALDSALACIIHESPSKYAEGHDFVVGKG
jgi:hypothetical protein